MTTTTDPDLTPQQLSAIYDRGYRAGLADARRVPRPIPLEKGEVRYLGYRPELEACIFAVRTVEGTAPTPLTEQIAERVARVQHQTGTVPVPVRTSWWAAYTGSAGAGNDISLHRTEREALEACYVALLYDEEDPGGETPDPKELDDEEIREKLDELCSGASDWAVCEVMAP